MPASLMRVDEKTRAKLRLLSKRTGHTMQWVIADAVEMYRRQLVLDRANAAFAAVRASAGAWQEEQNERRIWESTLEDGLED